MTPGIFTTKRMTLLALLGSVLSVGAQAPAPAEDKLREALKAVTLQLRSAQSEAATANAEKAASEEKNRELSGQVEKMSRQLVVLGKEKTEAVEAGARLKESLEGQLAVKQGELGKFQVSLDKWQAAHGQIADIAKKKEAARAEIAAKNAALERRVADLRARNQALFATGNDILERYRKFSLGEAIAAREPFTGLMRVKLQTQVQEYSNELLDQLAKP